MQSNLKRSARSVTQMSLGLLLVTVFSVDAHSQNRGRNSDFRTFISEFYLQAEQGLIAYINSQPADAEIPAEVWDGLAAASEGVNMVPYLDEATWAEAEQNLSDILPQLRSTQPYIASLSAPSLYRQHRRSLAPGDIVDDCDDGSTVILYTENPTGLRNCKNASLALNIAADTIPCLGPVSCGIKLVSLALWVTNEVICHDIEKINSDGGVCVAAGTANQTEENEDLLLQVLAKLDENAEAIEELRVILCDVEKILHTPQGQRSSECENCKDQPGYPYSWPKGNKVSRTTSTTERTSSQGFLYRFISWIR